MLGRDANCMFRTKSIEKMEALTGLGASIVQKITKLSKLSSAIWTMISLATTAHSYARFFENRNLQLVSVPNERERILLPRTPVHYRNGLQCSKALIAGDGGGCRRRKAKQNTRTSEYTITKETETCQPDNPGIF